MKRVLLKVSLFLTACFVAIFISLTYVWSQSPYPSIAGVPILNYHQVNDVKFSPLTMKVSHFRQQMEYLVAGGYTTITMDELYEHLENGAPLPHKPVLITFDDGYADNYENAYPILKQHGLKATIFMIGDSINVPPFLSAAQLKEMQANGIDIEAHTYSHKPLTTLAPHQVRSDLRKNKEGLEQLLQRPIRYLAYPQGKFNKEVMEVTKEMGFRLAFTIAPGNASDDDNNFAIPRLAIFEGDNAFLCMILRLHLPEVIASLWELRDNLRDAGHHYLASLVPLI